jgi:hypothetical protein
MNVLKFIDNINTLLSRPNTYRETENEFHFDCRVNKYFNFDKDKELLEQMKILGILRSDKGRYTKVQRFKDKTFRCMVINKCKFRSLEKLVLQGVETNDRIGKTT